MADTHTILDLSPDAAAIRPGQGQAGDLPNGAAVVTALANGGYAIAWAARADGDTQRDVVVQVINPDGSQGAHFTASQNAGSPSESGGVFVTGIAADDAGGFTVVYQDHWGSFPYEHTSFVTFTSNGNGGFTPSAPAVVDPDPVYGPENPDTDATASYGGAVAQGDGGRGFSFVWDTDGQPGWEIMFSDGTGQPRQVGTATGNYPPQTQIAAVGDNFLVTWTSSSGDPSTGDQADDGFAVIGTVVDASGQAVVAPFVLNQQAANAQYLAGIHPIAGLTNGNFVVSWIESEDRVDGTPPTDVYFRVVDAGGNAVADQVRLEGADAVGSSEDAPTVAALANGRFVIVWTNDQGLVAQVVEADGRTLGPLQVLATGYVGNPVVAVDGDEIRLTWLQLTEGNANGYNVVQSDTFELVGVVNGTGGDDSGAAAVTGTAAREALYGLGGNDTLEGLGGADQLDGGQGSDTASYRTSAAGVAVDLGAGTGQGGDAEGDTYASIENLIGSGGADDLSGDDGDNRLTGIGGADTLIGRGGADMLDGGAGADAMRGGSGSDTVTYASAAAGVTVDMREADGSSNTGDAQGDTFDDIEHFELSNHADTFVADSVNGFSIHGRAGDDTFMLGLGTTPTIDGGAGTDTVDFSLRTSGIRVDLESGPFSDVENVAGSGSADGILGDDEANALSGGGGDDTLEGRGGGDAFLGGAGTDTVTYEGSTVGVTIDLADGGDNTGDAAGDTYAGIETFVGSDEDDTFIGGAGANRFTGGAGADTFIAGSGTNYFDGDYRDNDVDTVSYGRFTQDVTVDLTDSANNAGGAAGDEYRWVQDLIGGSGNDRLFAASDVQGTLDGGAGDDILADGPSDAYAPDGVGDTFVGGGGSDTVSYERAISSVHASLDDPDDNFGLSRYDTYSGIENLTGSNHAGYTGDDLTGDSRGNVVSGLAGNDLLRGMAGGDTLDGGAGSRDVASYVESSGIRVSLLASQAGGNTGHAAGDTFAGVEGVEGGAGDDTLIGDNADNLLYGGAGDDTLTGGKGDDEVWGDEYASDTGVLNGLGVDPSADTSADEDVLVVSGNLANYTIAKDRFGITLADSRAGGDGTDILHGVETLRFANGATLDLTDLAPVDFDLDDLVTTVDEDWNAFGQASRSLGQVSADDPEGADITYSLVGTSNVFEIDAETGELSIVAGVDYENPAQRSFALTIRAGDETGHFVDRAVTIDVGDVDEAPVDLRLASGGSFNENIAIGTVVGQLAATDPEGRAVTFQAYDPNGLFSVSSTGVIRTAAQIDYERLGPHYGFNVTARDPGGETVARFITLDINDVQETAPNRAPANLTLTGNGVGMSGGNASRVIAEGGTAGTVLGTLSAADPDAGANGRLAYSLVGNPGGLFAVSGNALVLTQNLDFEATGGSVTAVVRVTDGAGAFDDMQVTLAIVNVNERPTLLTAAGAMRVNENARADTVVASLSVIDPDGAADAHTFALTGNPGGCFKIVGNQLRVAGNIDYEAVGGSLAVTVLATDAGGNTVALALTVGVGNLPDAVNGTARNDNLSGSDLGESLFGFAGNDLIRGGNGADHLHGGLGRDTLYGDGGRDSFVFDSKLGTTNVDVIKNYAPEDELQLDNAVFKALKAGPLKAAQFWTGTAAHDADDRLIYNSKTGDLLYDADGTGKQKAVAFADIGMKEKLGAGDFFII